MSPGLTDLRIVRILRADRGRRRGRIGVVGSAEGPPARIAPGTLTPPRPSPGPPRRAANRGDRGPRGDRGDEGRRCRLAAHARPEPWSKDVTHSFAGVGSGEGRAGRVAQVQGLALASAGDRGLVRRGDREAARGPTRGPAPSRLARGRPRGRLALAVVEVPLQ